MRSYAYIRTAVWRDPAFLALSSGAQRLYLVLLTRPTISACGALQITIRRWASLSADTTEADVVRSLAELADTRFLVLDWDTEEALVRSFVRHDGGINNAPRRKAILSAARVIESPTVAEAIRVEFERLGLPTDDLSDDPTEAPYEAPSQDPYEVPRVVVNEVSTGEQPTTRSPQSSSLTPHSSTPKSKYGASDVIGDAFAMPD